MGGPSVPSAESAKVDSNLLRLLHSLTLVVPSKPIPEDCIEKFNKTFNPSGRPVSEYFMLSDLWQSFEECSAYGKATPVTLKNGRKVHQYFTPYLSAIHICTNKKVPKEDGIGNGSEDATRVCTDESKNENHLKSASNGNTKSSFCEFCSGDSSAEEGEGKLAAPFQFSDTRSPYARTAFFDKIQALAADHPLLKTLRSVDLLPSSWMAVAWYPICHIPEKGTIHDLGASFITFHRLSSFHLDTGVDHAETQNRYGEMLSMMDMKKKKSTAILPPFGLAALNLKGDVWFIKGESDRRMYIDLNIAACSWLRERHFYHHDFNFFANRLLIRG